MPENAALASRVKALRHEMGKTQFEFSSEVGISEEELSKIERNQTDPKLSTIKKIAAYTGLTVSELLEVK